MIGFARSRGAGFVALTAVFLLLYWMASHAVSFHVGGDTTGFEGAARDEIGWNKVFSNHRPPLYPWLFDLTGFSRPLVVDVQFLAYILAWAALAGVFLRAVPGWLGLVGVSAVYYIALFPYFAAWNHVLMSESLSVSMSVAAFASLVAFLTGAGSAAFAGTIGFMIVKCLSRDFDAFLCIFFIPVGLLLAWYRKLSWRAAIATSVLLVAVFVFVSYTADAPTARRWIFAMYDNIGKRVLLDPRWLAYFQAHGMPVSPTLLTMTNRFAHENNFRFYADPRLQDFRDWILTRGRSTYTEYLVNHPLFILVSLWRARTLVFQAGDVTRWYFDPAWDFAIPPGACMGVIYAFGMVGFAFMTFLLASKRLPADQRPMAAVAVVMWLTILPIALAVYHADAMEIIRHALPVLLQAALALLLMLLVCLQGAPTFRTDAKSRRRLPPRPAGTQ